MHNPTRNYAIEWILRQGGLTPEKAAAVSATILAAVPAEDPDDTDDLPFGDVVGQLPGPLSVVGIHGDDATPPQLTADVDDYAPAAFASLVWRLRSDASRTITGLAAPEEAGEFHMLSNVGSNPIVLADEGAGSTAENRFACPGGSDYTLAAGGSVWIHYDSFASRWDVFGSGEITGFAVPAIVLGTAAAAGSAGTVIRSDSTIAAFDATAPSTSAVADAAAAGSAAVAARRDHAHGREAFGSPMAVGDANADGSAATVARSDHVHSGLGGGSGVAGLWDAVVTKASDDTVTNSAVLTNDSELSFVVATGETWRFEALILYVTDATGDYKCDFAISASTMNVAFRYLGTDTTTNTVLTSTGIKDTTVTSTTDIAAGGGSLSIVRAIVIEGLLFAAGDGTVTFRFAQNTQTAGQSAVTKAGSRILLRKLA